MLEVLIRHDLEETMRILVNFKIPTEPFNAMVRDGTAGPAIQRVLEALKPEAAYFYDPGGCRGGVLVVSIDEPAQLPSIAEPLFLTLGAQCDFHVAMAPADLARAGLEGLGRTWA